MNKLLRFLMPKTARRIDEQQLQIIELEKEVYYFKTRIDSKVDIQEKKPVRNGLVTIDNSESTVNKPTNKYEAYDYVMNATGNVKDGLVSTTVTSKSSPVTISNSPSRSSVDTFTPTVYSDSSYSSYSSSSRDSGSCCGD